MAIINFRGDKLYHEHIYWDQASVLVQIGLLDPKLVPAAGQRDGEESARRDAAVEHVDASVALERSRGVPQQT